jgi:hypothetical protein
MRLRFRLVALITSLLAGMVSTGTTVFAASSTQGWHSGRSATTVDNRCCGDHRGWDHGGWDHRGWDHRGWDRHEWRDRDWDHRGWSGWSWDSQCNWAWYNDREWWYAYCS